MTKNRLDTLLAVSAETSPSQIAVVHPGVGSVNYEDLFELSKQIAKSLQSAGVSRNDRVGICMPKSIGAVASIFASLHADACHVPVDSEAPARRSAYIFTDCAVKAILADRSLIESLREGLGKFGGKVVEETGISTPGYAGVDLVLLSVDVVTDAAFSEEEDLAYILYTSGSTGKPKGVIHTHATALAFIDWCSCEFKPHSEDRFSSHAPFHFDLSTFDLYVSLKHQSTLVLIGEDEGKKPQSLATLIVEQRISIWYSTPSILRLLVEYGELESKDLTALRLILYAGEVFPFKHLLALNKLIPHPTYYNLYGPTETNVCTYLRIPDPIPDDESLSANIGSVCSGDIARVVDEEGHDVAQGQEGELWISGKSVHRGYWNLPEKNAQAFAIDDDGTSWYKTGDLVIEKGQEQYFFLGRRDRMVKRRGYRVELGEIESILYGHQSISEAAVVAIADASNGVQLRAFIHWSGDDKPSILAMKRFSSENMLNYMIPDRFTFVSSLPKTSTDKIDYQKLKEL